MTRFVLDANAVLHIVREQVPVAVGHRLLAPTLLRSQVLSTLHEAVFRDEMAFEEARRLLTGYRALKLRLLGDAVLQRRAWEVADRLGWADTYDAEYIALTMLQADALVALDPRLGRAASGLVATATVDDLT